MPYRIDRYPIQKVETMPNGALRVRGTIARVGELKYLNSDGTTRTEYLTADELFSEQWLDSLANAPLTLGHPKERISPANWKDYAVGSVGGIPLPNVEDGTLDFVHIINDAEAIAAVQSGTMQLSPGYDVEIHQDSGKFFQRNRIANHSSIVQVARGGDGCKLHLDGIDDYAIQLIQPDYRIDLDLHPVRESSKRTDSEGKCAMTAIAIGNRTYNVDGDDATKLADAVAALLDKQTELDAENAKLSSQIEQHSDAIAAKDGELKGLQTKLDEAESSRMDDDAIQSAIASRMDAWGVVLPAIRQDSPDFQPDWKLDVMDIKRLWLLRQDATLADEPNFKNDGFVEGLWRVQKPAAQAAVSHTDGLKALVEMAQGNSRNDGYGSDRRAANAKEERARARAERIAQNGLSLMN